MVKMELNINSPKYYKDVYGVDDEIYRLCQDIYIYSVSYTHLTLPTIA